jgi:hypothetical protein
MDDDGGCCGCLVVFAIIVLAVVAGNALYAYLRGF